MEGNKGIFLVGDDALGYLAGPIYKKYSMTFIWGFGVIHFVLADLTNDFSILHTSPLLRKFTHLEYPLCIPLGGSSVRISFISS